MIGQAQLGLERLYVGEQIRHGGNIARYSVQVNARYNVSAISLPACENLAMKDGWFTRLIEVIKADGRSLSQLSVAARCGRNYVQQMIKDEKEPGADKLARLLDQLGKENGLYVYTGLRVTESDLEMLEIVSSLSPGARQAGKKMFEEMRASSDGEAQQADPSRVSVARG